MESSGEMREQRAEMIDAGEQASEDDRGQVRDKWSREATKQSQRADERGSTRRGEKTRRSRGSHPHRADRRCVDKQIDERKHCTCYQYKHPFSTSTQPAIRQP